MCLIMAFIETLRIRYGDVIKFMLFAGAKKTNLTKTPSISYDNGFYFVKERVHS